MNSKKHSITLDSRTNLTVTAVDEVISFDETLVSLSVEGCVLDISGEGLSIKNLSIDQGDVAVNGFVTAMVYYDNSPKKKRFGFFGG